MLGFFITKITRKIKLPDVTGYIILFFLINLLVNNNYITDFVNANSFISDIALSFIAFGTGKFFLFKKIKKDIKPTLIITIFEATLAGVFISLAFMGQRILNQEMGNMLLTIILASSILYELVGPPFAKLSLFLSGSIKNKNEENYCGKNTKLEMKYYAKK